MTDETIVRPHFGARPVGYEDRDATPTCAVPGRNLRPASEDVLNALGLGHGIPHGEPTRRIEKSLLREWRLWHLQQAAVISAILGDDGDNAA